MIAEITIAYGYLLASNTFVKMRLCTHTFIQISFLLYLSMYVYTHINTHTCKHTHKQTLAHIKIKYK